LHAGTHSDAPFHVQLDGDTVDRLPLETYMGPATVIEVNAVDVIQPQDLEEAVDTLDSELRPRVLLRTVCSEMPETEWPEAFPAISPAAVRWLDEHNTVLIGTDAPSVDPQDSRALPAHHAIWQSGMSILEHLDLRNAAPGPYQLMALPLRLEGMDAAPVRAVLVQV
jgi:arylformamidase